MEPVELRQHLKDAFRWTDSGGADPTGWWREPALLNALPAALGALHAETRFTAVVGVATRGFILGPLVAARLGVGFIEVRKDRIGDLHGQRYLSRATAPDYAQRDLVLRVQRDLLRPRDVVLLVDEWIATGAQATAVARLLQDAEAELGGVAVIVDDTTAAVRRQLDVRSLLVAPEL